MDRTAALIVAAGRGVRAGGDTPKQFAMLGGVPVIARAVDALAGLPVFVVIAEGQQALLAQALNGRTVAGVVIGGAERQDSVRAGLAAVLGHAERVLIHDAARPLLPWAVIERLTAALDSADGAVPVLPVADSVARLSLGHDTNSLELGDAVDRTDLYRVQTPQAFRLDAIMMSHLRWSGPPATDDAQVAQAAGFRVAMVAGDPALNKITHAEDFARAEALLARTMVSRSAMGFDVHRLETGEALWLGGILIPHTHGLSGHSDADVALHALTDALLGTIGDGDIGSHFPPSDPQWRGASSDRFVTHARDLIVARGGRIDHIDLTIICEAPRIGPHREAMRSRLGELLRLRPSQISIKATTTERLGFAGRGEGIAAQAIATVTAGIEL
ncbi:bifunctional 2-C-methyl-D-erythritol 4-phosphate cytidylyltransferase/2-C-methyl-D-erythritol 2,4-cyclodiphosphate synthase [Sphingomonas sp.]|uniref:bifunctional 2-C-methyl-D-erythritol 4-phosphate cytidylyltransferase/2-C-methyl-D-erythritol 2,4-cyclodiphosphate synthase n=1 Tax=Sphingomonas sp. TaxID=28214 RepID=UPI0025D88E75|nr:bifunctional 2-C-methyl-D-erythritol 4-phosphate cytidylyltransferase/2-C-methyl-D-erythritol 2,4-cyclodiphosphate synthase [Sphingomonas sp.]